MAFVDQLLAAQARHRSMLCVGLDPEPAKFPAPWRSDASRLLDFCCAIWPTSCQSAVGSVT